MLSKEDREGLIHIMNNPTTGLPHNQHVVSSQVHTVFAVDSLEKSVKILSSTIEALDSQNRSLQKTMVVLTITAVMLSVIQVVGIFIK